MRKIFISLAVIVSFVWYSFYQRTQGMQTLPAISPKSTISQVTPTTMPTSVPQPTSQPIVPTNTPIPPAVPSSGYKDGTYTGDVADAFYGNIQVQATIQNGRITNVQFLQYPNDRSTSVYINQQADPMLSQEAITAQSANVDIVSGATDSSNAFIQSLSSALSKAKA